MQTIIKKIIRFSAGTIGTISGLFRSQAKHFMKKEKFTIKDFNKKYSNDDACLHQIFINRYGNLENCPECQSKFSFHKISDRKCYACAYCGHQLHPLAKPIILLIKLTSSFTPRSLLNH